MPMLMYVTGEFRCVGLLWNAVIKYSWHCYLFYLLFI